MRTIDSDIGLRDAIIQMEIKLATEEQGLQEQAYLAWESMNPVNLISSILNHITESPLVSEKLINSTIGLTAGYVSKLLFQAFTKGPIKKPIGTAIMFGIAKVVSRNPESIKTIAQIVLNIFLRKPQERQPK